MGVMVVRDLLEGTDVFFQLLFGSAGIVKRAHFRFLRVALIELDGAHQAQHCQPVLSQQADVAVVIEQGAAPFGSALGQIPAGVSPHNLHTSTAQPAEE